MAGSNAVQAELLLGELKEVSRLEPNNVAAYCRIGGRLNALGREREALKCYRAAVEALRRAARLADVQRALDFEDQIYRTFVKAGENEEHYRRCFADWKDELAALGRRFRAPPAAASEDREAIAFFLHSGPVLGHTEVLLKLLEGRPRAGGERAAPRVYIFHRYEPAFLARCRALGIEAVPLIDVLGPEAPWLARFQWLRERFVEDRVGTCVWVSVPTMAAFALPMRIAPVQIFWALRFHPISGPDIDGHITWGNHDERTRRYGEQDWEVVPMPFAGEDAPPDPGKVAEIRRRYGEPVLLGTLAREEKIHSPPFLRAVADILTANPQAGYLWTGRSEHPGIAGFFREAGVAARCHYVGWVDTRAYVAALDVFLESFPYGFGIIGYQAFAAGVPLLSYLDPYTVFGVHHWRHLLSSGGGASRPRLDAPDRFRILCARDADEYVALAGRLINDAAWRRAIGERGRAFYREELQNNAAYAGRFFATVDRIVERARAGSSAGAAGAGDTR